MDKPSNPLATESFSYSWLIEGSPLFTERLSETEQGSFDFDLGFQASSESGFALADEIFSDGRIMSGYYTEKTKVAEALNNSTVSVFPSPVSSCSLPTTKLQPCRSQRWKWRSSSNKLLHECLRLMKPLMVWRRKSSRVDDLERKVFEVESLNNSHEASPRASSAYSVQEFSHVKKPADKGDLHSVLRKVRSWNTSSKAQPQLSPSRPSNSRVLF